METKFKIVLLALSLCTLVGIAASNGDEIKSLLSGLDTSQYSDEIKKLVEDINKNPDDTQKLFQLQILMANYSTVGQIRTALLKTWQDTLKSIARNIGELVNE